MKYLQGILLGILLLLAALWFLVWLPPALVVFGLLVTLVCGVDMIAKLGRI